MQNLKLFAYFNIDIPMVAWEVAIGRVKSICDNNPENFGISLWQFNHLKKLSLLGESQSILDEFRLEAFRQKFMPDKVSRLQGVYFFESEEIALIALERWGLSRYKKYLSQVNFSANSVSRYDSEWITSFKGTGETDWFADYLAGKTRGVAPLTEVLASGIGIVMNKELRAQAYQRILKEWPTSTPLLYFAIAGFCEANIEDVALTKPALVGQDGAVVGSYFIYMESLRRRQAEIAEAVKRCREAGMELPIVLPDSEEMIFSVPDLRSQGFTLQIPEAQREFGLIHQS